VVFFVAIWLIGILYDSGYQLLVAGTNNEKILGFTGMARHFCSQHILKKTTECVTDLDY